ncbi:IclR family transcriptional regulator [Hoeflea sp. WL0058]|uniref:IclR family transcriptional regulator n=1 Tax=Flavimaribacter sediminis TaxID=2865987 RepID=A0AAE2ZJK9_9HYPH|nr:IclR family transcriptional regulator [Flavimaribacter sediminis]MBW8637184.1 IclR family transcriptional regulator [Flavimaribacter sediminis]
MSQINRCFDILELFFENPGGLSLSEISARTDIPMATAHRILSFIKNRGYVYQDAREIYYLSLLLPSMGANYIGGTGFRELLQPHLDRLAALTGEHVRLSSVVDGQIIWVLRAVVSSHGLQYRGGIDTRIIPHTTASGKMWLSSLNDEEALRIVANWNIEQSRNYAGPKAVTSVKSLLADLKSIRKLGYSIIIEEAEVGVCAIAMGVYQNNAPGQLLGTISVAGPTARLDRNTLESLVPDIRETAQKVQETWSLWTSVNREPIAMSSLV